MFNNLEGKYVVAQLKNSSAIVRGWFAEKQPEDNTVIALTSDVKEVRMATDDILAIEIYTKEAIDKMESADKAKKSIVRP